MERPCQCHNSDSLNSKIHPDVLCISVLDGETHVSCNAQQQKSINDYNLCCSDFEEALVVAIEQVYWRTAVGGRTITSALLNGKLVGYVLGFLTATNECNMDPLSYIMTVLDCSIPLASHHNISLPEQHSVQMAFQVLPHTCVFFGIGRKMLLRLDPICIPTTYRKG
jgi:hypothetical protein